MRSQVPVQCISNVGLSHVVHCIKVVAPCLNNDILFVVLGFTRASNSSGISEFFKFAIMGVLGGCGTLTGMLTGGDLAMSGNVSCSLTTSFVMLLKWYVASFLFAAVNLKRYKLSWRVFSCA